MDARSQFKSSLEQKVCVFKGYLEGMFGPCSSRFAFGQIEKSTLRSGGPQTPYPGDPVPCGCYDIDIQISKTAWDNCDYYLGAWDVAHETVHLLDPVPWGAATYLEEGLGAWFQDQPEYHVPYLVPSMKDYLVRTAQKRPPTDTYTIAKDLVSRCDPEELLIPAVRQLRSRRVKISEITPHMLTPLLPNVNPQTVARLCEKFPC